MDNIKLILVIAALLIKVAFCVYLTLEYKKIK